MRRPPCRKKWRRLELKAWTTIHELVISYLFLNKWRCCGLNEHAEKWFKAYVEQRIFCHNQQGTTRLCNSSADNNIIIPTQIKDNNKMRFHFNNINCISLKSYAKDKMSVLLLSKQKITRNLIMQSAILPVLDCTDIMYSHMAYSTL